MEMTNVFSGGDLGDHLIHFVNYLDPNGPPANEEPTWPKYNPNSPKLLTLLDGDVPTTVTEDTFRQEAIAYLQELILDNPF
jgi:acetylcholinesterase